ncbi:P1 family peptidase [Olivibacter sp. SDN3]|uniref:DmpA family aminopeptidase n=1 Tax=Olivibacter sp. SDN3 TaxID=2764720 RepID=UPI0021083E22|nr:P1 family peptidase [Olivibacter sp. SDN3]
MHFKFYPLFVVALCLSMQAYTQQKRARSYGIQIGVLPTGHLNAITDVQGIKIGHVTRFEGDDIRTGVTAILPHEGNIFQEKVPAAVFTGNGFGKLAGSTQITELGNIETPIILTNTLNVATGIDAVIDYTLKQKGNEKVQSVNAVVGETNDGYLNDIRGRHVTKADVINAIQKANGGLLQEGNVGAGTGTVCFGFKGGIGTSSRQLPQKLGGYTVGVIIQSNFGGVLQIDGVNIGRSLGFFDFSNHLLNNVDGSCMIVVATDAPLDNRNLHRLAKRAFMGLAKTGGIASNGSGDYVIAFSTAKQLRIPHDTEHHLLETSLVPNDQLSPLFMAAIEATEEAIINSLFMAESVTGVNNRTIESLPLDKVLPLLHIKQKDQ